MADNIFRAFPPFPGGSARWVTTDPAGDIAREGFFGPPDTGGGGGGPGPLTYADYVVNDPVNAGSTTFTGVDIGAAASDRWVIVALQVHNAGAATVSSVTISGVSATLLYEAPTLTFAGTVWSFWKANVPTGTTASVAITTSASFFYWASCAAYYCTGEPVFHDGAFDNTYTGTTFSVAVDVPEGGAVIAGVFNDGAGALSSWVGVTADWTDDSRKDYYASADELSAETGRTVSFTTTAASSSTGFYGLGVLSVEVPELAGGGGITGTLAATESGSDVAAFAGDVLIDGALSAVEAGADTASFSGDVPVSGVLAATEAGSDSAALAGNVRVSGALAAAEAGADSAAFSGAAPTLITGTLAATEGGSDTAAFAGVVPISGSLATAESGSDTAAFSGPITSRPRGDDAFKSSGQRERFWRAQAEEELEALLDRAERAATAPPKARRRVVEAFALVEWEKLPEAPRTRDLLASLKSEQPDYTHIAALVLAIRQEIEAERTRRRRKRDLEALMVLAA